MGLCIGAQQSIGLDAIAAARALLHANLTPAGLLAATPGERAAARRYTRIFGRDAAICALGMALDGEAALVEGAWRSLETLARHQAASGQIPKFVDPQERESDFWYLGCIDATLWWLIALDFLRRERPDPARSALLEGAALRALAWLRAQEHPALGLLQQNEASDWADIFPRSGFVLYGNALWYGVKRRYRLDDAERTRSSFNALLRPDSRRPCGDRRLRLLAHYAARGRNPSDPLYLSHVGFASRGDEGDVFGNLLAILFGLCRPSDGAAIVHALARDEVDRPVPVRAVCRPIGPATGVWRPYMGRHRQNLPFQYHNGGAWTFIGGFWVAALALLGRSSEARAAWGRIAAISLASGFNEWHHGESGVAMGMPGQSWNAAQLLFADAALRGRVRLV